MHLLQPFVLMTIYFILVIICSFLYLRAKPPTAPDGRDFLFSFFLYILSELFIVGSRGGYNQIKWLFTVFLITKIRRVPVAGFYYHYCFNGNGKYKIYDRPFSVCSGGILFFLFYLITNKSCSKCISY